ncbi:crustacean hyperglycemic hormone-like [Tachypleus tridentatus]|uniref:crustacean hyperglycemic hormone-like n=1 Tax=Tachypleus tridentatus TaxID=6853 RepID=UPI003FD55617
MIQMAVKQNRSFSHYVTLVVLLLTVTSAIKAKPILKRSFADLGCMGDFNKAVFARLGRVCEECYHVYRDPFIHLECRSNCFKNSMFADCVETLLMHSEEENLIKMVDTVYGK